MGTLLTQIVMMIKIRKRIEQKSKHIRLIATD